LTDEKPPSYWDKKKIERAAVKRKRVNIFLSRTSGNETGATTYEESKGTFIGGTVQSRSRVSTEGRDVGAAGKSKFGRAGTNLGSSTGVTSRGGKSGFAQGGSKMSSLGKGSSNLPPRRPLGF
jgi:hypothetical protein